MSAIATAPATDPPKPLHQPTRPPLWPQPIPVIGVTGPIGAGKTIFGLLIDPARTLVYDEENSSKSYEHLGVIRVDVHAELNRRYPNGYKPIQAFEWWANDVRARAAPGYFSVIMQDTVALIENGLVDWVEAHPDYFGHTVAQHRAQNGAMKWGDVSKLWKQTCLDLATRCETFVFTTHMADVFKDGERTGKLKPKGNKVLMEIASLYLELERKAGPGGELPQKPTAKVIKSRLVSPPILNKQSGELELLRILPPRMPVATPFAIRQYFANPAGDKLRPEERPPDERLTEDEKLQLQAETARSNARAEELRAERDQRQAGGRMLNANAAVTASTNGTPGAPAQTLQEAMKSEHDKTPGTIEGSQLATLTVFANKLWKLKGDETREAKEARWQAVLAKAGVSSARELSREAAEDLIAALDGRFREVEIAKAKGETAPAAVPTNKPTDVLPFGQASSASGQ
jgi:hypothetical protein